MDTYDKSVPGMKITEVGTPDARLLRQWAADPKNMMCWGLDRVADRLEASESYARGSKVVVAEASEILRAWMETEIDPEEEEYAAWMEEFTLRVQAWLECAAALDAEPDRSPAVGAAPTTECLGCSSPMTCAKVGVCRIKNAALVTGDRSA